MLFLAGYSGEGTGGGQEKNQAGWPSILQGLLVLLSNFTVQNRS